jgi:Tn3 transposase DDE domain-containing protein
VQPAGANNRFAMLSVAP